MIERRRKHHKVIGYRQKHHKVKQFPGVMIYISAKLEHTEIDTLIDDDGRFIVTKCIIQGQTFLIVNAYPPNDEKTHCSFMQN